MNDMRANAVELSIIMPCLNEIETLGACIEKAQKFIDDNGINGEIVIGDNGSDDGSIELAESMGARVAPVSKRGYGAACIGAADAANGQYIIMGDSDMSYDFSRLEGFVEQLRDGADLVMGNRFQGGIAKGAMPFKNRYLGNPVLSTIGKVLFKTKIGDFHCGLRGFSKDAYNRLGLTSPGMEFASEMVMKASLMDMDVREVPTTLDVDGRSRAPHLRPWRDGWRHLKLMFLYSPRYLFLVPGLAAFLLGIIAMFSLIFTKQALGYEALGSATLIYAAALVIVGAQAVLFSWAAKVYGIQSGMLPPDERITKFNRYFSSDRLLLIGVALFLVSAIGFIYSLYYWGMHGFGNLEPFAIASISVPVAIAAVLGCELILFALFTGIILIKNEPN